MPLVVGITIQDACFVRQLRLDLIEGKDITGSRAKDNSKDCEVKVA
jgi:hypothetical protein